MRMFFVAAILLTMLHPTVVADERPNIVFCFADDWGRFASAYAALDGAGSINDVIRTPNFDRIAREGMLFRRAFVSAPSCTPCRSALLSGQHFWRTGRASILRGAVWDGSNLAWPLMLNDSGYHIGETYKVWSPGTPNDAPFGGGKFAYEKAGGKFNQFSQNVTALVEQGKSIEDAKGVLYEEVRGNFDAFLAARESGQPFCYWFGPTEVHRKWLKGSGKALWGIDPDSFKGKLPPFLPDVPEVREDLADYFGEIQSFDAALGLLMEKLEAIGELDNTLVVVSGDHGAPGFPHGKCNLYDFGSSVSLAIRGAGTMGGRVVDDLITLPDLAPTILELAGLEVPEQMTGRSLLPLVTSNQSGQIDEARDAVFIGRERHVENARADFAPYPQRAIRTHDFLYIVNFRPDRWPLGDPYRLDGDNPPTLEDVTENTRVTLPDEDAGPTKAWLVSVRNDPQWKPHFDLVYGKRPREELYDLRVDPHQVKNVATNPAYAVTLGELEQRLMTELRRTGDPRLVNDGEFFETPPMAGPVEEEERPKQRKARTDAGIRRETREISGWQVHIQTKLLAAEPNATEHALTLLKKMLDEIVEVVPADAVKELQTVPLYFSPAYKPGSSGAEFHPSADWLRDNGRDPVMAEAVEFSGVADFEAEMNRMPNFALHELAHAYHFRVLQDGFDNAEITAAFERAKADGKYEKVKRHFGNGRSSTVERAYAMSNRMEYFAESTEAYFVRNDFFPFDRDELMTHDPEMHALLETLWGVTK